MLGRLPGCVVVEVFTLYLFERCLGFLIMTLFLFKVRRLPSGAASTFLPQQPPLRRRQMKPPLAKISVREPILVCVRYHRRTHHLWWRGNSVSHTPRPFISQHALYGPLVRHRNLCPIFRHVLLCVLLWSMCPAWQPLRWWQLPLLILPKSTWVEFPFSSGNRVRVCLRHAWITVCLVLHARRRRKWIPIHVARKLTMIQALLQEHLLKIGLGKYHVGPLYNTLTIPMWQIYHHCSRQLSVAA